MSERADWLTARTPAPPERLARVLRDVWVEQAGEGTELAVDVTSSPWHDLARTASTCLREALERPGRDRRAAFHLLAADALFTYACEAALDSGDAEAALLDVLAAAAG